MFEKGSFHSPVCLSALHSSSCIELASISFGALAKANRDLGDNETSEEDESEGVYEDEDDQSGPSTRKEQKTREEMKRQNKHAWVECSFLFTIRLIVFLTKSNGDEFEKACSNEASSSPTN